MIQMDKYHDVITVGLPILVILAGILFNQRGIEKLETRINRLDGKIDQVEIRITARIEKVQADLSGFHRSLGQHDEAIATLQRRP